MHSHIVQWQAPSPVWSAALKDQTSKQRFRQPTLLRFDNDNFMDELTAGLEKFGNDETAVSRYVAQYEDWRHPQVGWQEDPPTNTKTLKLYHPAHQRFYLVAASLVCRIPGLPDRVINSANDEKVSFVLRRLVPDENNTATQEYGWFTGLGWRPVPSPLGVDDLKVGAAAFAEERLPMFPMSYGENGSRRRMLAGFLPVGSRESYEAASGTNPLDVTPPASDPLADYRLAQFETAVIGGFVGLRQALANTDSLMPTAQAQEVMLFAMLDLAEFIDDYLPAGWDNSLSGGNLPSRSFTTGTNWDTAMDTVLANRTAILNGDITTLSFIDSQITNGSIRDNIAAAIDDLGILNASNDDADASFEQTVKNNLPANPVPPGEQFADLAPDLERVPKVDANAGALYVVRCVYEKQKCAIFKPVVSQETSVPFQLAPFFDPDAPARPIRIAMPVDTSIKGLRKFPKSVSFLISNELRKQMDRVQNISLEDLDNGDIPGPPNIDIGMICSLSIPIITICALILLMIIVSLLNIIFFWIPFLKICLPISIDVE